MAHNTVVYALRTLVQTYGALFRATSAVFKHSPLTYDQIFARATEGHAASAATVRSRQPVRCQEPPTVAYARACTGSLP
jgi:hypothetical protein